MTISPGAGQAALSPAAAAIDAASLAAFYRDMTLPERRTFWACAAGWALDGMDFMIYPLVIGTIIRRWDVSPGPAGLAVTATLFCSALGGWLGGFLSDRIGRVRMLQISIVWFSLFSIVCALAQNFGQLLIARAVLGFGFGAEWAAGAVLMGETIRAQYRGRAVGCVQSAWAVGWGLAVIAQAVLFSLLPPEQAWRWMFVLGAAPALLVYYLRRSVEEPEIAAAARPTCTALALRSGLAPTASACFSAVQRMRLCSRSLRRPGGAGHDDRRQDMPRLRLTVGPATSSRSAAPGPRRVPPTFRLVRRSASNP